MSRHLLCQFRSVPPIGFDDVRDFGLGKLRKPTILAWATLTERERHTTAAAGATNPTDTVIPKGLAASTLSSIRLSATQDRPTTTIKRDYRETECLFGALNQDGLCQKVKSLPTRWAARWHDGLYCDRGSTNKIEVTCFDVHRATSF